MLIGKCHLAIGDYKDAITWLQKAKQIICKNEIVGNSLHLYQTFFCWLGNQFIQFWNWKEFSEYNQKIYTGLVFVVLFYLELHNFHAMECKMYNSSYVKNSKLATQNSWYLLQNFLMKIAKIIKNHILKKWSNLYYILRPYSLWQNQVKVLVTV